MERLLWISCCRISGKTPMGAHWRKSSRHIRQTPSAVRRDPTATGFDVVLALACLAEAGLLVRTHYARRNDTDSTDKEKTRALPGDASQALASVEDADLFPP